MGELVGDDAAHAVRIGRDAVGGVGIPRSRGAERDRQRHRRLAVEQRPQGHAGEQVVAVGGSRPGIQAINHAERRRVGQIRFDDVVAIHAVDERRPEAGIRQRAVAVARGPEDRQAVDGPQRLEEDLDGQFDVVGDQAGVEVGDRGERLGRAGRGGAGHLESKAQSRVDGGGDHEPLAPQHARGVPRPDRVDGRLRRADTGAQRLEDLEGGLVVELVWLGRDSRGKGERSRQDQRACGRQFGRHGVHRSLLDPTEGPTRTQAPCTHDGTVSGNIPENAGACTQCSFVPCG